MKKIFFLLSLLPAFFYADNHKIEIEVRKLLCETIIFSNSFGQETPDYWYWIGKKEGLYEALLIIEKHEYTKK